MLQDDRVFYVDADSSIHLVGDFNADYYSYFLRIYPIRERIRELRRARRAQRFIHNHATTVAQLVVVVGDERKDSEVFGGV